MPNITQYLTLGCLRTPIQFLKSNRLFTIQVHVIECDITHPLRNIRPRTTLYIINSYSASIKTQSYGHKTPEQTNALKFRVS